MSAYNIKTSEMEFLLSFISSDHHVLEYGFGNSTKMIASKAKFLTSVEHDEGWYNGTLAASVKKIENLNFILARSNWEWMPDRDGDGTLDQFKDYVQAPIKYSPFDVILIDGRARVGCASVCHLLGHSDTQVFIHDYNHEDGRDYSAALIYLEEMDSKDGLFRFKTRGWSDD